MATLPTEHFGLVMYVHGSEIDRPLELIRESSVLVLHTSWRGQVDLSTDLAGQYSTCGYPGATTQTGCADVTWPGQETGVTFTRPYAQHGPRTWYGDLSQGSRDVSGQLYMRNRYYDPTTGRFTQEDPVGLAGGMNLYGFAGGDPVNFSDPFGLCTNTDGWRDCEKMVNPATSQYMAQIAPLMGEWTYSQAPSGGGFGKDPTLAKWSERLGDCSDLVRRVTLFAVNASSSLWKHNKTGTRGFRNADHDGYTEIEADMVRPGDIVVQGSHAGIFQVWNGTTPIAWANNGSPHRKDGTGYRDRPTGLRSFAPGSFGTGKPRYFRPIVH